MKPELMLLVWATLLTVVQAVVAVQGAMMQVGLPALAGNREGMPEIKGWGGRAARAHRNMIENLVLFAALVLVAVSGATLQVGLPALAGNREGMPEITGWGGRAARAHRNMLESLVLFAVLVLVAVAAGKTNDMTLLGAQIFFWARLAYALVYIAGIAWLRTGVWAVSVVGLAMIFLQLI